MDIYINYAIGDILFFMHNNEIQKGMVQHITMDIYDCQGITNIDYDYSLITKYTFRLWNEDGEEYSVIKSEHECYKQLSEVLDWLKFIHGVAESNAAGCTACSPSITDFDNDAF